jgi:bla regulator protein BlaR1
VGCGGFPLACTAIHSVPIQSLDRIRYAKKFICGKDLSTSMMGTTVIPNMANMPGAEQPTPVVVSVASLTSPIEIIWLVGMCVCMLFFIVAYVKHIRQFKMSLPIENNFGALWLQEDSLRRPVQIRQSDRINTPLTYGIFRPVVLLPKNTDWTDEMKLRYVLAHEYTHIRRFDTLTKLVLTTAVCVHWFNPLVWVMYVLANRDIELPCNETVVRTLGEIMKSAYALTLIGLEEKKRFITPLVNRFSKNAIEERIVSIMKTKKTTIFSIVMALALVIGTITVFATSAVVLAAGYKPNPENIKNYNSDNLVSHENGS